MDQALDIGSILSLAAKWAEEQHGIIMGKGKSLTTDGKRLAGLVGVKSPDRVRILEVDSIPIPADPVLKEIAINTGLMSPDMAGLTLGYGIFIRTGHLYRRLLSHELRHVYQYEHAGSIQGFLNEYIEQILQRGYYDAPLEVDARNHEIRKTRALPDGRQEDYWAADALEAREDEVLPRR